MALPEFPWYSLDMGCSGETKFLITMDVEGESLKDLTYIKNTIATPLENLHPVIEPLNEPTGEPLEKVVRDLVEPGLHRSQEAVKLFNGALTHPLTPGKNGRLCILSRSKIFSEENG
jgi:hypothetical protein